MGLLELILIILTGLLLFSTAVCGLYLRFSGQEVKDSDRNFHLVVGVLTAIFTVITMGVLA